MSATTDTDRYTHAAAGSRFDRNTSRDALHELENALSAPAPGRERSWLDEVGARLDHFLDTLDTQAFTDADSASLLSDIAVDQPRLAGQIDDLRAEHRDIVTELRTIRHLVDTDADVTVLRVRLADAARRFRRHRALEADLVYEAVNVDLGVGD